MYFVRIQRGRRGATTAERPGTPSAGPAGRQQAQYLRRLGRVIAAAHGAEAACELRWQEERPYLPYLLVHGVPVWGVLTSTGWRFLWNRYRSHSVTDLSGAVDALRADLGLPPASPGAGPAVPRAPDGPPGPGGAPGPGGPPGPGGAQPLA